MPMLMQAESDAIFAFLLDGVLGLDATAPPRLALIQEGIMSLADFMTVSETELHALEFTPNATAEDPNPVSRSMTAGCRQLLVSLKWWILTLQHENNSNHLTVQEWQQQTANEFDEFRISGRGAPPVRPPALAPSASSVTSVDKEVLSFKMSTKRNTLVSPVCKEQRQWNNWNCSFIAQDHVHDCREVCDGSHAPSSLAEMALLKEKQSFAHAVSNKAMRTDRGKAFVPKHESNLDAQKIYEKLMKHAIVKLTKDDL